jgi:hypothetical protein
MKSYHGLFLLQCVGGQRQFASGAFCGAEFDTTAASANQYPGKLLNFIPSQGPSEPCYRVPCPLIKTQAIVILRGFPPQVGGLEGTRDPHRTSVLCQHSLVDPGWS